MSNNIPTSHITAKKEQFANTVLMPGDPLRSKFIAENFLSNAELINNVRGVHGYTGTYKGKKVSVMASGMGMPSIGIYSYELFNFYDVDNILRIGSAGAIAEGLEIKDIVIGQAACTNSSFALQYRLPGNYAPISSFKLLKLAVDISESKGFKYKVGNLYSSDIFYDDAMSLKDWQKMGVLAVEMEAAALYMNAARANKNALAICTISDCPFTGQASSAEERQTAFTDMMELSLEMALEL